MRVSPANVLVADGDHNDHMNWTALAIVPPRISGDTCGGSDTRSSTTRQMFATS